jgi:3-oxoacyl-[acyl-carrier-protein] synthase II
MANGASDFLKPSPELLEAAIREALATAQTPSEKIDFIAGSASGSPHCDHFESEAICRVFGERAKKIPVFPYKSFLGSTFGTQAVSEGALAIRSMNESLVPEPFNIFEQDERVKANVYYNASDYAGYEINRMLFINYGFAGNHMAMVLEKCGN